MIIKNLKPKKNSYSPQKGYYYDYEGLDYPFLFLGCKEKRLHGNPKAGSGAIKLAVQSAGYACHQHLLHGWVFAPINSDIATMMRDINEGWLDSCVCSPPSLNDALRYRSTLQEYGLDCNNSYDLLEEALYPIDNEYIDRVCGVDDLGKFINANVVRGKVVAKPSVKFSLEALAVMWNTQAFQLFIIGDNCD